MVRVVGLLGDMGTVGRRSRVWGVGFGFGLSGCQDVRWGVGVWDPRGGGRGCSRRLLGAMAGTGLRFEGSGFRVQGSGFRVQGSGFRIQGSGVRVQGSGFRVQGSGFRVQGLNLRVEGFGLWFEGLLEAVDGSDGLGCGG